MRFSTPVLLVRLKHYQDYRIIHTSYTECCYECANTKLAINNAQAKDFGEADIYVYKCDTDDDAVCCVVGTLTCVYIYIYI